MLGHWLELAGMDTVSMKTRTKAALKVTSLESSRHADTWRKHREAGWTRHRPPMSCLEDVNLKDITMNLSQEKGTALDGDISWRTTSPWSLWTSSPKSEYLPHNLGISFKIRHNLPGGERRKAMKRNKNFPGQLPRYGNQTWKRERHLQSREIYDCLFFLFSFFNKYRNE